MGHSYEQPFANYPSQKGHDQAWEDLARNIAALQNQITDQVNPTVTDQWANSAPQRIGELTIIGSGIETIGFTTNDQNLIEAADKVFYCVADPATVVWLKALRPDAYDLYVLYDDSKVRYITYMQMTEALLYYVRQGKKVLGIYYGHPGIFVLSSHRAIKIARREGFRATMRAGISALDTLCADLGVDPSQPGMQTFEATDMLIRSRVPDTSLHVVLWQVGLVGELGYRRSGYINRNFSVLVEYLQDYYGKDYPVTNYIGSRYPGIEPTTDVYTLEQLHSPEIQTKVTGISTFYLAPKIAVVANVAMMERLGMAKPGTVVKPTEHVLRQIDQYGDREMVAFKHFATFKVPRGYHWQEDTAAARFILALTEDVDLQQAYQQDPVDTITSDRFQGLSDREKVLLLSRDAGSVQLAAKGIRHASSTNGVLVRDLLCNKSLAKSLRHAVNQVQRSLLPQVLEQWSEAQGYEANWARLRMDFEAIIRNQLYPWSGAYLSHQPQMMIFILGSKVKSKNNRVYVNGTFIRKLRFQQGRLQWSVAGGNPHNGYIHVDLSPSGSRRLAGMIWPDGESIPANHNFVASEVDPDRLNLSQFIGHYELKQPLTQISIDLAHHPDLGARIEVYRNGSLVETGARVERNGLAIEDFQVPFKALQPATSVPEVFRSVYRIRRTTETPKSLSVFDLTNGTLNINGQPVEEQHFSQNQLIWTGGPQGFAFGDLLFLLDPISLLPMCYGTVGQHQQERSLQITGMKPVTESDRIRLKTPAFGLPLWAWEQLLNITYDASHQGGLFLWSAWERHSLTHRILQSTLSKASC